jgi:hypothetical protein
MKIQAQAGGLLTTQLGDYSKFYKKIDYEDFKQWLNNNYQNVLQEAIAIISCGILIFYLHQILLTSSSSWRRTKGHG